MGGPACDEFRGAARSDPVAAILYLRATSVGSQLARTERRKETHMGKVVASASMSLDGYIAKDDNTIGHLFDWFDNGNIEARTINPDITFHLNQSSFDYWQGWVSSLGALVCGRTLFDFTDGWDG